MVLVYWLVFFGILSLLLEHHLTGADEDIATIVSNFFNQVDSGGSKLQDFYNTHPSPDAAKPRQHNNNWAVLVSTSKFWYNYRHMSNTLSLYHIIKEQGIPDSQIILMLADDMACNARNSYPAQIFNNRDQAINLYGENVEVDYRGYDVTVDSFFRVLTDRHGPMVTKNKRLMSDKNSNIFIYMTGHGGDEFLKFQDVEEISAQDLAIVLHDMYLMERFNNVLLMVDTCQAGSLFNRISTPGVVSIGSSALGENSYSHHMNDDVGVAIIDQFTYYTLDYFENLKTKNNRPSTMSSQLASLGDLIRSYRHKSISSTIVPITRYAKRNINEVPLSHFFSQVVPLSFTEETYFS